MESGVKFVAVDNEHATPLTIHILAAVAQHERSMISQRTKDALAAAKRRGASRTSVTCFLNIMGLGAFPRPGCATYRTAPEARLV